MSQTAVYVSPPPSAPLLHEHQAWQAPDTHNHARVRTVSMFDRRSSTAKGAYTGADLRPLRPPMLEKGRVTVKNVAWNWGADSGTHPYLLAAASSSVVGVDGHDTGYTKQPHSAIEPRAFFQGDPIEDPNHNMTQRISPPSRNVDERIFFNDALAAGNPPLKARPTHKRGRSRTFTSSNPPSFPDSINPKSRSETTLGKHKSKLTLQQFQLLVTESSRPGDDVIDVREDARPQTRRGPKGFHLPTSQSSSCLHDPGFSEPPSPLVIPPAPRIPAPEPPSPASFYSASSSPHSDPGYDSDSNSTVEAMNAGKAKIEHDDPGFDSDDALSLPPFYRNPKASHSDETLGTMGSIGSIGTLATVGTMDTMGAALRSLGPAQLPTIRGIRSRVASVDKNGGVVMTERPVSKFGVGEVKGPRVNPKARPEPRPVQETIDSLREKQKLEEVQTKGVLRPKDRRSLETPSSLSLSTHLLGLPTPHDSTTVTASASTQRPHSSAVAAHRAMVDGNIDVNGPSPAHPNGSSQQNASLAPPRPPRRVHRVPPPLVLQPPAPPMKSLETKLALSPKSSTSFRFQFQPPPTPLSPALSFMSTVSALSTVSTIAAVMMNRPKTKQPRMSEKELRRRRFLKLAKTLGEDVPPELISVKAAPPRRSRTISFGGRLKGSGSRDSVADGGNGKGRMKKKRKESMDGRRTAGARHSIAVSPLEANFPSIPEGHDRFDEPLSPISPNVLRKYPSLRRRSTSNPGGRPLSDTFSRVSVNPSPILSPEPEEREPPVVAPYFEDHPFRLVVNESSPVPPPTVPDFVDGDARTPPVQARKVTGAGPRASAQRASKDLDDGARSSAYSMNNPWMRTSLALPLSYDTPFIEYALPSGIDRKAAETKLGVGHHRRLSSLDAISPRRSTFEPLGDDTHVRYGSIGEMGDAPASPTGGRFSAIGGLHRSNGAFLDVPQEVDDDEGEWENLENGVYRKERRQGWSGEWNQPHIQTVIEKLRQL